MRVVSAFSTALFCSSAAFAGEQALPFEEARSYDGTAFEVNVPCAESALRDFVGEESIIEFNSEVGLIFAATAQKSAIIMVSGERAESDLGHIDTIVVNNTYGDSTLNYTSLEGSFISATAEDKGQLNIMAWDAQNLEAYLRECSPSMQMS